MKKVLIVTSSPFNNTKLGKMCSQLMCYLRSKGLMVAVAAWDHDTSWYVEDEEGVCWYKYQDQRVGPVYTVFNVGEGAATKLYEVVKALEIDTILSVGDFSEVEYVYAIKSLEKKNIEWINILNNGASPINDSRKEIIDSIDYHILLNDESVREFKRIGVPEEKYTRQKYGSRFINQPIRDKTDTFGIACVAKNSNQSNLGCFIKAIGELKEFYGINSEKVNIYLHTDLYDGGDYDIEYLIKRYGVQDIIELPEEFIGANDGLSDDKFKNKLINYDLIVDCSCQSATAISVLDGMALGLIPLVSHVGALKEIVMEMLEYNRSKNSRDLPHAINGNDFVAADEKEFYICDHMDLAIKMWSYYLEWKENGLENMYQESQDASMRYDLQVFLENTFKIIKDFQLNSDKLVVETF